MKAFDPIAAGLAPYGHGGYAKDGIDVYPNGDGSWHFYPFGAHSPTHIPASFDHAHVVALLRANGADIPEPDHAD